MNLTKFDLTIIVVMSIATISMSFVFPALGLTDASTNESDVPEFDIGSDRFDFAGEVPDNPGTPSQGELELQSDGSDEVRLHDNSSHQVSLSTLDPEGENLTAEVYLSLYNETGGSPEEQDTVTLSEEGDTGTLEVGGYAVDVEWIRTENVDQSDETAVITYEITDQPSGETWLTRLPVVGGIVSGASALAGIVGWIGSLIWWGFTFFIQTGLNVVTLVFDVAVYFVSTLSWLTGTYADIVSSADAWAAVFVSIPGILLFGEFAKIVMVLISLLPTT